MNNKSNGEQLCEYENQTLEDFVAASRSYLKYDCAVAHQNFSLLVTAHDCETGLTLSCYCPFNKIANTFSQKFPPLRPHGGSLWFHLKSMYHFSPSKFEGVQGLTIELVTLSSVHFRHAHARVANTISYPEPSNFLLRMLDVNEGLWKGLVLKVRK